MAGPGGVLVGRGYVVIRPEFAGDWDRRVSGQSSRSGALGGRAFGAAFGKAAGVGVSALGKIIKVSAIGAGAAGAVAGIAQLGPAALAASAVAVPALSAIGTAGAAVGVGLKGVGDAFKAFDSAAADAKAAASATRQVESAQRALARAQQGVSEARVAAARRVADAERAVVDAEKDAVRAHRDVIDAQRDALDVQKELTSARLDATRQLEDLNARVRDSALDQRDAALRVTEAEKDLAEARQGNDQDAIARAELSLDRAKAGVEQQARDYKRLQEDAAKANKAGVEGSEQVVAARERIADANERVGEAADRAAEADQKVADAQRDVADAHADGAKQIADANEAVADAARALADAQSAAASTVSKVDEAMAKLTPNARDFVTTVKELGPAWGEVRKATQESLFAGVGDSFESMSKQIIPDVRDGLAGAAGQINLMWRNWMDGVKELSQDGTLRKFFDSNTKILGNFVKIPDQMTQSWVRLSIAATPALDKLTLKVADASTRWSDRIAESFESGRLEKKISGAFDVLGVLREPLRDIGTIFKNLFDAMIGPGEMALGVFGQALDGLARITSKPEVKEALTSIFTSFGRITESVLLDGVLPLVERGLPPLARGLEWVADVLPPAVGWLREFATVVVDKIGGGIAAAAGGAREFFGAVQSGDAAGIDGQASALERFGAAAKGFTSEAAANVRAFVDGFKGNDQAPMWFESSNRMADSFDRAGFAARSMAEAVKSELVVALDAGRGAWGGLQPVMESTGRILVGITQQGFERIGTVIQRFFLPVVRAVGDVVRDHVAPALEQLGGKLSTMLDRAQPVISFVDTFLTFLVKVGSTVLGAVIPPLIQLAGPVFGFLFDVLGVVVDAVGLTFLGLAKLGEGAAWLGNALMPVFEVIGTAAKYLGAVIATVLIAPVYLGFQLIAGTAMFLYDKAIKPAFEGISAAATWMWTQVLQPTIGFVWGAFQGLGDKAKWLHDVMIKPFFDKIGGAIAWTQDMVIAPAIQGAKDVFESFGKWVKKIHDEWVKPWMDTIGTAVSSVTGGFKGAFDTAKTGIEEVWGGIKKVVADPINWVIDFAYGGLANVWNAVAGKLDLAQLPPASQFHIGGYATGGIYPGYTPGRDVGVIGISGGEAIMRPEWTRAVGSDYVHQANAAARGGGVEGVRRFTEAKGLPFLGNFDLGGVPIVDDIKKKGEEIVRGFAADGVELLLKPIRSLVNSVFPDTPEISKLAKNLPLKIMDNFVQWVRDDDAKQGGGPVIQKALEWAKTQAGKKYQWGGGGNPSWDCSGFMAGIQQVILGRKPGRLWTTFDFAGSSAPPGWQQNLTAPFMVGVNNFGPGHMAGTIGGVNVESRAGDGVVVGPNARGWNDPMFYNHYGFKPSVELVAASNAPTGLLGAWIAEALRLTGTPPPNTLKAWMAGMATIVSRESGGNVFAINTTDSNAAANNASRGLAQVVPTTFAAHHQEGTSWDIFNPVANLAASINYIKSRYGDIKNVQQADPNKDRKGYAFGGVVPARGTHDVGGWLPHGQAAVNMSGRPEAVLTYDQMSLMQAAAVANNRGNGNGIGEVRVFVGDREITDIVRTEVRDYNGAVVAALSDGRG